MSLTRRTAALAIATSLAWVLVCTVLAAPPPPPAVAGSERLTGTVRAVDTRTRTFDLLTGVGHALRVRHIRLPAEFRVSAGRAESPRGAVTPGAIVRVDVRTTPTGTDASSIEVLQTPPASHP